jgi:putative copper export protein
MKTLYWTCLWLHLMAALTWLGGMFFLGAVGAPVLRDVQPAALRQQLFDRLGRRARTVGWWAIGTLLATGTAITWLKGWFPLMDDAAFWRDPPGRTLAWKLALVTAMLVLSAVHDFSLGPRAGRAEPGSDEAVALRRRAAGNARLTAALGLLLVYVASRLARGG